MGVCWCKKKQEEHDSYLPHQSYHNNSSVPSINQRTGLGNSTVGITTDTTSVIPGIPVHPLFYVRISKPLDPEFVDRLVLETLGVIATLVDNEQEPPPSMLQLHAIADNEEGFVQVVNSMINVVPLSDPLGPSIIALLLDDCPLPSRESVFKVIEMLNLSKESALSGRSNPSRERNVCVVIGCIAETLAGPTNLEILSNNVLDYLFTNLELETDPNVMLFSLIALEKFAQSSQNKIPIMKRLEQTDPCPVKKLEEWREHKHYVKRQVGFCAQWILDNLFVIKNRQYSYLTVSMTLINAMLNTSDVSEYLKISPDGLEARCDAYSFESVRCTAQADTGIWYYEVLIITPGVMQIGWATKNSNFLNHEGYGIGDDKFSLAYDGCRKLIWYNAKSEPQNLPAWQSGDILGCLLDLNNEQIVFSVNGVRLPPCSHVFTMAKSGFFAAASFMSFQQCRFNFGAENFRYAPHEMAYSTFNETGDLKPEEKIVMPRHIVLDKLKEENFGDDCCEICFDKKATVRLMPCGHSGFCRACTECMEHCPICRRDFNLVVEDNNCRQKNFL